MFVLYFYQLINFRDIVINLLIISAVEIDLQRRYSHIYHIKHLNIFEWNHFQSVLGTYNTQLCLLKSLYWRSSSKQMISGKASYRQISWNREIGCHTDPIALQFDRILGNVEAQVPIKFQSVLESWHPNPPASRLVLRDLVARRLTAWWIEAQSRHTLNHLCHHGSHSIRLRAPPYKNAIRKQTNNCLNLR